MSDQKPAPDPRYPYTEANGWVEHEAAFSISFKPSHHLMAAACDREIRRSNFWSLTGAGLVFASLLAFYLFDVTWSRVPALVGIGAFLLGVGYGGAARRIKAAGK